MNTRHTISGIYIYPIKSLGGISLDSSKVETRGLAYDRRWMLVDNKGMFLTQRAHPLMALLQPHFEEEHLVINNLSKTIEPLKIPLILTSDAKKIEVQIWKDKCHALELGKSYNDWFSESLGQKCRLVYMPDSSERIADQEFAKAGDIVSFADAFPVLILGESALAHLNGLLAEPIPMNRFRPNLVFTGGEPHLEDTWSLLRIGEELLFRGAKLCGRCQIPTIDQKTAKMGKEPTATLATYRKRNNKIYFGQTLCWEQEEKENLIVKVGDEIAVLE